jgi:hypothetical protein
VSGGVDAVPLTSQDQAILQLEGRLLAGHTCKVIELASPAPSFEDLRARIAERVRSIPPLTMRLGDAGGHPAWVSQPDFDPDAHVVAAAAGAELDSSALRSAIARLFGERLDRGAQGG